MSVHIENHSFACPRLKLKERKTLVRAGRRGDLFLRNYAPYTPVNFSTTRAIFPNGIHLSSLNWKGTFSRETRVRKYISRVCSHFDKSSRSFLLFFVLLRLATRHLIATTSSFSRVAPRNLISQHLGDSAFTVVDRLRTPRGLYTYVL